MSESDITQQNDQAEWEITPTGTEHCAVFELKGNWKGKVTMPQTILNSSPWNHLHVNADKVTAWGSPMAAFIFKLQHECNARNIELDIGALPTGAKQLLHLANAAPPKVFAVPEVPRWLERLGQKTETVWEATLVGSDFVGSLLLAFWKLLHGKARMRWQDVWVEIVKAGPDALFIVNLIGFLIGLILAFIGAIPLKWFRAELYVASLIGIGMCRLMGATMTGVVMAGRTGASYAAELGTMQVNEELDALSSMGIDPMEFLILPRFIALTLMMPLLCIFADIIGIIGGMIVGVFYLDLSILEYWNQMAATTRVNDIFVGLFTSFVFGILISICGCLRGLYCGRSSASVGQATTSAMVSSIICLVIATSIITVITVTFNI